jgi:hypothetical protein
MPALLYQGANLDRIDVTSADAEPVQADQDTHQSSIQSVNAAAGPGATTLSCRSPAPRGSLHAQFGTQHYLQATVP